MNWVEGEYTISDDKTLLSIDRICAFLARCHWAKERPRAAIERSLEHSICYGVYHCGEQVGFARVVTDKASIYWLCDVFLDEEHRGRGLGKKLVECIVGSEELRDLAGILATKDAHGLYEQYGFIKVPDRFMRRSPVKPQHGDMQGRRAGSANGEETRR